MAERRPHRARSARLDQPMAPRSALPRPHYDPDVFGRLSERFARFLGTARFLVYLTLFVALWIIWNIAVPEDLQFDAYANKFTLLTLILSLQASYAAPLILLAQNRQESRDRVQQEQDRDANAQSHADMEFLAREVASLRLGIGEVATRDFLRGELRGLLESLEQSDREPDADD